MLAVCARRVQGTRLVASPKRCAKLHAPTLRLLSFDAGLDLDSHLRTLCVHGVAHLLGCVGLLLAATICRAVRCDDPW